MTFHDASEGGEKEGMTGKTIYIEAYEEYLNYSDPLEEYNSELVYDGLPWGAEGTTIGRLSLLSDKYCSSNFYNGYDFTEKIVQEAEAEKYREWWEVNYHYSYAHLNLNTKPKTAAGYCYIKNKRDSEGNVPNPKWYLPGIRELERILEDYYAEYEEFQHNYYWSSTAGEARSKNWFGNWEINDENTSHARATKAYIDNGVFRYYESGVGTDDEERPLYEESGGDNGNSGRARRTTSLRIRAARIDNLAQ